MREELRYAYCTNLAVMLLVLELVQYFHMKFKFSSSNFYMFKILTMDKLINLLSRMISNMLASFCNFVIKFSEHSRTPAEWLCS